jgi:hypothetical protein
MADQARGHRVEHLAQREAARGGDADADFLVIRRALTRQRLQFGAFEVDAPGIADVAAADDLVDEAAIGGQSAKSAEPRISSASWMARLRWPCGPSMAPFSWAMPVLLREGVMP